MVKIRKQYTHNFTLIDNGVLDNEKLSWKAKGLFCYLWRQPDDWEYYESEVVKHSTDGIAALKSGLKELEEAGYLHRERAREKGQLKGTIWNLTEHPTRKPPMLENPMLEKPTLEKPMLENQTLPSTNLTNTNNTNNSTTTTSTGDNQQEQTAYELIESLGVHFNSVQQDDFLEYSRTVDDGLIKQAVLRAAKKQSFPKWSLIEGILKTYLDHGIKTAEAAIAFDKEYEEDMREYNDRKRKYRKNQYRPGQTNYQATGAVDFLDPRRLDEM